MQPIKRLTPSLAVSGQLEPDDMAALAAQGFRCVINNRPDGEGAGQPNSATLEAAARDAGLDYSALPVRPGEATEADVAAFRALVEQATGPVLAFCRTGTRSVTLWALAEAPRVAPDALLATAAEAGYDLSGLRPQLEQRRNAHRHPG